MQSFNVLTQVVVTAGPLRIKIPYLCGKYWILGYFSVMQGPIQRPLLSPISDYACLYHILFKKAQ
jgi:hypothetical protein